jgi:glycosyltransferase involved in cell wall biosynthesis
MKILLITPMPPQAQAPGAIPLVLYAELIGLMERHQVTLVTLAGREPGEKEAVERLSTLSIQLHVLWREQLHGIQKWRQRWRMASTWLKGKYPWRTIWFWEPELQNKLNELLSSSSYDLILVDDNAMGIYEYQTSRPILFTEYEVRRPRPINWNAFWEKGLIRWAFEELDWIRWRRYQADLWRRFDGIQAVSQRDAAAIRLLSPELSSRVRVNPFGVVLPAAAQASKQKENTIVFVGNYTHPPNVDAALWLGHEIMPLLRKLNPRVSLTLIGIYPPKEVLGLAGQDIKVAGPVVTIEPFLEQASLVVAPVRIGGGMRMKVLHAMAMGKAVVTTSRGTDGLAMNGSQPPLIVADDAENFAEAIACLLSNHTMRIDLGVRAREFVQANFSAQAYARRIETNYAEMKKGDSSHEFPAN